MFTGLIAELATVRALTKKQTGFSLTLQAPKILPKLKVGDSVAVNGVCLSITNLAGETFTADVMPETVRLTNLRHLCGGDRVNVERALRLSDGLDGHLVSGHIEGVGNITAKKQDGIAWLVTIKTPPVLLKYIAAKGSIAIDGISLTVTAVGSDYFCVALIPLTMRETTLGFKDIGAEVNLETDVLAKYVERLLKFNAAPPAKSSLAKQTLLENGFM